MENKLAKIVAILTVAVFMAAGPVAYAESDGNNSWDNPGDDKGAQSGPGKGFVEGLNLNGEQRDKFKALEESDKEMTEQIKKKTQELDTVVSEPGTTRSDADYLLDEISTLQAKMLSQKMDRLFALKKVLTSEQFEKMQEMNKPQMNMGPGGSGQKNPGPDQN